MDNDARDAPSGSMDNTAMSKAMRATIEDVNEKVHATGAPGRVMLPYHFKGEWDADGTHVFRGEWDDEGVFVYQAFNDQIADYALEHQRFGGPQFNAARMTWIKPSFAWVLYRSGYAHKHGQRRILKMKLPHAALAMLLGQCQCREGGGGSKGRVQWDPARDLMAAGGREPRKMLRARAIQIGLSGSLSEEYVHMVVSIEDVTALAHRVGAAHAHDLKARKPEAIGALLPELPVERAYLPRCAAACLVRLMMVPDPDDVTGGAGDAGTKPDGRKQAHGESTPSDDRISSRFFVMRNGRARD